MKFQYKFLKRSGVVFQIAVIGMSLSCNGAKSAGGSLDSSTNGRASESNLTVNQAAQHSSMNSGIRKVDFADFTYPWYPSFLESPSGRRELRLESGQFEVGLGGRDDRQAVFIELEHVYYADLTGDGNEDAIVYLAGSVPTNSFLGNLLIYTLQEGQPRLLWQHETGDRGNGGLRGFRVEKGDLVVEEYAMEANREQSLCCPKNFLRSYYRWENGGFIRTQSSVLPNEYPNAYFKGYANDQR